MRRGRTQVLWRYMPGALFRYNESGGWSETSSVGLKDTRPLSGSLKSALTAALHRWKAIGVTGYPDPDLQGHKYIVGEPLHVMYDAWPLVFLCRNCGRVQYYRDIEALRNSNDRLGCPTCKGRDQLRQIPYGYICECGRKDTLFVPRCPRDKTHSIALVNKRSFQESYWICQVCRTPLRRGSREGLGYRRCDCAPKKGMRGVPLEDSRAFYSQTIALVDIDSPSLERWYSNPHFSDLLLEAAIGGEAYKPSDLISLANWKPSGDGLSPELKATLDAMIESGIDQAQAEAIIRQGSKAGGANPWVRYTQSANAIKDLSPSRNWAQVRRTVEYVFVRDEPSIAALPLVKLAEEAESAGDLESASRLRADKQLANQMGFASLAIVRSLPILLAGYGFTRYFGTPRDGSDEAGSTATTVSLRPFPQTTERFRSMRCAIIPRACYMSSIPGGSQLLSRRIPTFRCRSLLARRTPPFEHGFSESRPAMSLRANLI